MVKVVDRRPWATTGLDRTKFLPETAVGFLLGATLVGAIIGFTMLCGSYKATGVNAQPDLVNALILLSCAAATEELIFRGYIFQTLERAWGTLAAVVIGSILFGLSHMLGPSELAMQERLYGSMCLVFGSGLLYSALYLIRRRLWLPVGMHCAWNYFQGPIFGLSVSGLVYWTPLLRAVSPGSELITGGKWGIESAVPAVFVRSIIGIALLVMAYRRGEFLSSKGI